MVLHRVNNKNVEHFDSAGKQPKRDIVNSLFSKALSYQCNNNRVQNYHTDVDCFVCITVITVAEEEPSKVFCQIFQ